VKTITHVLDTSALLAHFFDEPGAGIVESLWAQGSALPGISVLTVAELRIRLGSELSDNPETEAAIGRYLDELTVNLPVDRAVAECAWQLRTVASSRLPLVDAIIAATARSIGATLVHRDPHLRAIPEGLLAQIELPG
jgi:predicted nucleic acid-binding protein